MSYDLWNLLLLLLCYWYCVKWYVWKLTGDRYRAWLPASYLGDTSPRRVVNWWDMIKLPNSRCLQGNTLSKFIGDTWLHVIHVIWIYEVGCDSDWCHHSMVACICKVAAEPFFSSKYWYDLHSICIAKWLIWLTFYLLSYFCCQILIWLPARWQLDQRDALQE